MPQLINSLQILKKEIGTRDNKILMITKNEDLSKECHIVEKPMRRYFLLKPEYWEEYRGNYVPSIEREKLNQYVVEDKFLVKNIVDNINDPILTNFYQSILQRAEYDRSAYRDLRNVQHDFRVFDSDGNIVDQYISKYLDKYNYQENSFPLLKGFYDIEVDGSQIVGFPDPEKAEAPINIISYYDNYSSTLYSFALKYNTDTYNETMTENAQKVIKALQEKYKGRNIKFDIRQFDNELDLIKDFFNVINEITKPDYMAG